MPSAQVELSSNEKRRAAEIIRHAANECIFLRRPENEAGATPIDELYGPVLIGESLGKTALFRLLVEQLVRNVHDTGNPCITFWRDSLWAFSREAHTAQGDDVAERDRLPLYAYATIDQIVKEWAKALGERDLSWRHDQRIVRGELLHLATALAPDSSYREPDDAVVKFEFDAGREKTPRRPMRMAATLSNFKTDDSRHVEVSPTEAANLPRLASVATLPLPPDTQGRSDLLGRLSLRLRRNLADSGLAKAYARELKKAAASGDPTDDLLRCLQAQVHELEQNGAAFDYGRARGDLVKLVISPGDRAAKLQEWAELSPQLDDDSLETVLRVARGLVKNGAKLIAALLFGLLFLFTLPMPRLHAAVVEFVFELFGEHEAPPPLSAHPLPTPCCPEPPRATLSRTVAIPRFRDHTNSQSGDVPGEHRSSPRCTSNTNWTSIEASVPEACALCAYLCIGPGGGIGPGSVIEVDLGDSATTRKRLNIDDALEFENNSTVTGEILVTREAGEKIYFVQLQHAYPESGPRVVRARVLEPDGQVLREFRRTFYFGIPATVSVGEPEYSQPSTSTQ